MPLPVLQIIMAVMPGMLELFTSVIIPVAGKLLKFTIPRLARVPLYIRLLWTIYQDQDNQLNAEARKYLTSVLLLLGSILTFMVYSYIPLTGVPIIGAFTTPVAGVLALVISLIAFDTILAMNREYLINKDANLVELIEKDTSDLSRMMGKSWEEMVRQTQALLDVVKNTADPEGDYKSTLSALINALICYLNYPQTDLDPDEINRRIVTEGLSPLVKTSGSVAEGLTGGAVVGTAAHGVATNMFVQAGFWTSIKSAMGLAGGIVVGAPAYTALAFTAPVGLAIITGAGIYHGVATGRIQRLGESPKKNG